MLLAVVILKSIIEVSVMVLFGRFLLGRLIGTRCQNNLLWQILDIVAKPALTLTRALSPNFILSHYIPLVAATWLTVGWLIAVKVKVGICLQIGLQSCGLH